jgi:hypothetical protein
MNVSKSNILIDHSCPKVEFKISLMNPNKSHDFKAKT